MRRLFGWDLPPGVSESDIPGNRPEDAAADRARDELWDELGREPTDAEVDARVDAIMAANEPDWDALYPPDSPPEAP